jgi:hypothetical protein
VQGIHGPQQKKKLFICEWIESTPRCKGIGPRAMRAKGGREQASVKKKKKKKKKKKRGQNKAPT